MPSDDESPLNGHDTGIVILGHGSRAPDALDLLSWVERRLADRLDCRVVAASLQFNSPTLEDCCRQLAGQGVRRIVVAPYFLYEGNHFKQDIPEGLDLLKAEFPGIEFILTGTLGADERLVDVLADRIEAHRGNGGRQAATSAALPQHSIEVQSFEIIDDLLKPADARAPEYQIVRRVVHATGDPGLAGTMIFSDGAITAALTALEFNTRIICDVKMVASGIEPTATRRGLEVLCGVADEEAARLAAREGLTRGAAAIRLAAAEGWLDGAVVAVGNAPTALWEVIRLVNEGIARPGAVIGVPVGFVGAAESKQALAGTDIPHITLVGNRGGSSVAVAVANALLRMQPASGMRTRNP